MEKILVIQMKGLVDIVQTMPLLKTLKQSSDACHITILGTEDIEKFSEILRVDRVLYLPDHDIEKLFTGSDKDRMDGLLAIQNIPELKEEYDSVVNVTGDLLSSVIANCVKGKIKTGRVYSPENEVMISGDWAKYFFSLTQHKEQNLFNVSDILTGFAGISHLPIREYLEISAEDLEKARLILEKSGYQNKSLVAFHISAYDQNCRWSVGNYARLAELIAKTGNVGIVLIGTNHERTIVKYFSESSHFHFIDLTGKTTVTESAAILKHCDCLISDDSAFCHIAAAVGTRTLSLHSAGDWFMETAPYGEGHVVIQAENGCACFQEPNIGKEIAGKGILTAETVYKVYEWMVKGYTHCDGLHEYETISLYRSEFLSNGTVIYLPVNPSVFGGCYSKAFLSRFLWENILGVSHDNNLLNKHVPFVQKKSDCIQTLIQYKKECEFLRECYTEGRRAAQSVLEEYSRSPINNTKIMFQTNILTQIDSDIIEAYFSQGFIKGFHSLEMMDMPSVQYPDLALLLEKKYAKMLTVVEKLIGSLNILFEAYEGK